MQVNFYPPSSDLIPYVKYYWKVTTPYPAPSSISPSGYPELIFQFGDPVLIKIGSMEKGSVPLALIAGQITRPVNLTFSGMLQCFCVKLMPYSLRAIFRVNSSSFTDSTTDMGEVDPGLNQYLFHKLTDAGNDMERVRIIETTLRKMLRINSDSINALSSSVLKHCLSVDKLNYGEIIANSGASRRTLERNIKQDIGLTPKKFLKIIRFNRAFSMLKERSDMNLQDIAYLNGYYDLPHFINEFREYSGCSPIRYLRQGDKFNSLFTGLI
ncbi:MAG: helix-turn-helix domain-containing protein [Bacteroidales bacterium]|nr:helix-turn-helix domain-containing protein [Bacteroidales bacterium]